MEKIIHGETPENDKPVKELTTAENIELVSSGEKLRSANEGLKRKNNELKAANEALGVRNNKIIEINTFR